MCVCGGGGGGGCPFLTGLRLVILYQRCELSLVITPLSQKILRTLHYYVILSGIQTGDLSELQFAVTVRVLCVFSC